MAEFRIGGERENIEAFNVGHSQIPLPSPCPLVQLTLHQCIPIVFDGLSFVKDHFENQWADDSETRSMRKSLGMCQ